LDGYRDVADYALASCLYYTLTAPLYYTLTSLLYYTLTASLYYTLTAPLYYTLTASLYYTQAVAVGRLRRFRKSMLSHCRPVFEPQGMHVT